MNLMLAFNKQVNASIVDPAFIASVRKKLDLDQREAGENLAVASMRTRATRTARPSRPLRSSSCSRCWIGILICWMRSE
jgi:Antitoxin component of bacterial toxin-antitoxin system, MqsA